VADPPYHGFFILFYQRFIPRIFGNEGILALKNIYRSKDMLNNITLLTIGLASLLLINTISFSVTREVAYAYSDFKTDIMAYMSDADRKAEASLKSVKGVESVLGFYERGEVEIAGTTDKIGIIYGMDGSRMSAFMNFRLQGDEAEMLQKFAAGRTIIPSTFMKRKMDLKEGDF
jgi:putative ABC transport system permease protein